MSTQPLLNALRIAFFLGSACALFTTLRWDEIRPHVVKLDAFLVERYVQGPTEALSAALTELKEGREEAGLRALSKLAKELRDVRVGTRLQQVRSTALDVLSAHDLAAGREEAAMAWTQELLQFNLRDFPALLRRAELHRRAGNEAQELADIRAALRVGAEAGPALLPLIESLARRGDREEVAAAWLRLDGAGSLDLPAGGWEFRWSEGADSEYVATAAFAPGRDQASGLLRGEVPATSDNPAKMQELRVDMPGGIDAVLRSMTIELTTLDGSTSAVDLSNLLYANHLTPTASGGFVAAGQEDPYLVLRGVGDAPLKDVVRVSVTMDIQPLLPPVTRELFPNGITDAEREAWTTRFGRRQVAALEAKLGR